MSARGPFAGGNVMGRAKSSSIFGSALFSFALFLILGLASAGSAAAQFPVLKVSPSSIDFGTVSVGTQSPSQTVTATNEGPTDLTLKSITTSSPFLITSDNCPINSNLNP